MSEILLQVNFDFSVSKEEYQEAVAPLADKFAELPGLRWKVWILNSENSEAGGIYMFENQASVDEYLAGPLAKIVTTHPALSNFSIKQFAIMEDVTKITRGPI
ncbi:MAG: YdhR family protein [Ignavibacteria bacterium]|nr:YdhR family protein [Ignavibacteria bacterium]MBT8390417.1 YdhR family protein [Ignavibacteria bacterium]NNJ52314.1 YdhR family protein [Ignavibacteriaceae bacterium]